ncbi:MAG TPA: APC family permease, partial [Bryobacterales bacterium]|nr:APC family permease [Bryobacterales bacterium]
RGEQVGPVAGISIFGLDALSSAAYGPEAALTLLIPLGLLGPAYLLPITISIIILLAIVYFSYRQTIQAYPGGGGSYTVARENLGARPALLAGAALMTDYVLTAAVGISAGVGALVSAVPSLQPHTLALCLFILAAITVVNLRGLRDSGLIFMGPTYLFIGCLFSLLAIGLLQTLLNGGHPAAVIAPPKLPPATAAVSLWLLLKAFASGCTAMTGVEAVSNGVKAFREPAVQTARRTLTIIIVLLMALLGGIAWLVRAYGIGATDPGKPGYDSVLSQLAAAVAGKGAFYYVTMASILLVLAFSANTAFADFPRLCRAIASDGYLPNSFADRGRRLVFTSGIIVLAALSAVLLILFGGVTDRLIPLYAVGAFLAFTMSQAGMVAHWRKKGGPGSTHSLLVNGLGAFVTAITVAVVMVAKFAEGAWVTMLLIPGMLLLMQVIRRHYRRVALETDSTSPLSVDDVRPPLVVVPMERWSSVSKKGLRLALTLSPDVVALHVAADQESDTLQEQWDQLVAQPARRAGLQPPQLVVLPSPYRFRITPIVDYIRELEAKGPGRQIAVLIPDLIERRWYQYFLHRQRGEVLAARLLLTGSRQTVIINVPWHLGAELPSGKPREG